MQAAAAARVAGKDGIHDAVVRGDVATVQDYLIADEIDESCVDETDDCGYGYTPPTPACIATFATLISCSISFTPLHLAAACGHVDVVQLLLSCSAAVDANDGGYRPYHCIVV